MSRIVNHKAKVKTKNSVEVKAWVLSDINTGWIVCFSAMDSLILVKNFWVLLKDWTTFNGYFKLKSSANCKVP